jgi:hypothetical protein
MPRSDLDAVPPSAAPRAVGSGFAAAIERA